MLVRKHKRYTCTSQMLAEGRTELNCQWGFPLTKPGLSPIRHKKAFKVMRIQRSKFNYICQLWSYHWYQTACADLVSRNFKENSVCGFGVSGAILYLELSESLTTTYRWQFENRQKAVSRNHTSICVTSCRTTRTLWISPSFAYNISYRGN